MIGMIICSIVGTFLVGEILGFFIHHAAHHRWSGPLYRKHIHHHTVAHPPQRYRTSEYVGALSDSFAVWFIPAGILMIVTAVLALPPAGFMTVISTIIVISLVNGVLHDSFHVQNHPLAAYTWHRRLGGLHEVHHRNVRKNLGIYFFWFDRLAGSFRRS